MHSLHSLPHALTSTQSPSPTPSLTHSPAPSHPPPLPPSHTHQHPVTLPHSLPHTLTSTQSPAPTPSLTHSPAPSHPPPLPPSHTHQHPVTLLHSLPHTLTSTQSPSPTPSRVTVADCSVNTSDAAWGFPLVATVIGTFQSMDSNPVPQKNKQVLDNFVSNGQIVDKYVHTCFVVQWARVWVEMWTQSHYREVGAGFVRCNKKYCICAQVYVMYSIVR